MNELLYQWCIAPPAGSPSAVGPVFALLCAVVVCLSTFAPTQVAHADECTVEEYQAIADTGQQALMQHESAEVQSAEWEAKGRESLRHWRELLAWMNNCERRGLLPAPVAASAADIRFGLYQNTAMVYAELDDCVAAQRAVAGIEGQASYVDATRMADVLFVTNAGIAECERRVAAASVETEATTAEQELEMDHVATNRQSDQVPDPAPPMIPHEEQRSLRRASSYAMFATGAAALGGAFAWRGAMNGRNSRWESKLSDTGPESNDDRSLRAEYESLVDADRRANIGFVALTAVAAAAVTTGALLFRKSRSDVVPSVAYAPGEGAHLLIRAEF